LWLHSLKVAQLLRSAACLHTNQSRSYLNHLVFAGVTKDRSAFISTVSLRLIDPGNEGATLIRNAGNYLPIDTASYAKSPEPSKNLFSRVRQQPALAYAM